MSVRHSLVAALIAGGVAVAGCGGDTATVDSTSTPEAESTPAPGGGQEGGALGGGAATATLARADDVAVPEGEVAWVGTEVTLAPGDQLRHAHSFSTVYAQDGDHELSIEDRSSTLAEGEGAAVPGDTSHVHAAPQESSSVFWEVRLAEPGSPLPEAEGAETVFESDPLEGIPESPSMAFIRVDLVPGAETSVHTHPGPEFIYGTQGSFTYENGLEGERAFDAGDQAGIPPDTPVQKRNETDEDASFLSWFLVDPDEPFAPGAEFDGS
jgi:quercetin dioxygenase-like cupin family protein